MPAARSPFPGMDPWLEPYWGDVHHTMMSSLRRQTFGQLPAGLYAAVERTVIYIDAEWERHDYKPDVAVLDGGGVAGRGSASSAAVAEPIRIVVATQPVTADHVEIRELRDGHPLVTAIEVLSPTNMVDARGRAAYAAKRDGYYAADANVVEIDLLRVGQHLIDVPLDRVRAADVTPYKCGVRHRAGGAIDAVVDYYPLPLCDRLSRVRVPLRNGDPAVVIDLQQCVDEAYAEGHYAGQVRYDRRPAPPLAAADAAWAAERIAAWTAATG